MEKEELEVLIEIRDFFRRHKQEIAKELGESDNALREALKDVKDTSYYSITELKRQIVEQSEAFKDIINEERDAFIDVSNTMKTQFDKQVKAYPSIAERLDDMAEMPHKLDVLVNKMEQYNWQLVENVNNMIRRIDQRRDAAQESGTPEPHTYLASRDACHLYSVGNHLQHCDDDCHRGNFQIK